MKKEVILILLVALSIFHVNCIDLAADLSPNSEKKVLVLAAVLRNAEGGIGGHISYSVTAPNNFEAVAITGTQIDLSWIDSSNNENGFSIEQSTGANFTEIARVNENQASYCSTELTAGITYYYRIRAFNSSGNSDYSNVASATTSESTQSNHYIRPDATGDNNGTDWDNAWTQIPNTLTRGHTYYISDGSYSTYTFDDAAFGSINIIIKKATISDHGTEAGWTDTYGDGIATLAPVKFTSSYYILDGQSKYGIKIVGGYQGHIVSILSSGVIVRNCELDGNFVYTDNYHTNGACTGIGIGDESPYNSTYVTIENCYIHNIADDGVQIYNSRYVYFKNNIIRDLHSSGTDESTRGPCDNGHSDSFEIFNLKDSEISGNFAYDSIVTNAALFFGNVSNLFGGESVYCRNIILANNIFYTPQAGFVVYFNEADGIKAYNNVFWGRHQGNFGGISIWRVTNLDLYNNIILSIYYRHMGDVYNPSEHRGDYNLFGYTAVVSGGGEYQIQPHDIVNPNPLFVNTDVINGVTLTAPVPEYFILQSGSSCVNQGYAGDTNIIIPSIDFWGTARPQGVGIDIGANELIP